VADRPTSGDSVEPHLCHRLLLTSRSHGIARSATAARSQPDGQFSCGFRVPESRSSGHSPEEEQAVLGATVQESQVRGGPADDDVVARTRCPTCSLVPWTRAMSFAPVGNAHLRRRHGPSLDAGPVRTVLV
jgi:hypothetical protein